jgi:ABC-type transport system substrate-binding protein
MDRVTAPDPQTISVHWKRTYPDAAALDGGVTGMSSPSAFPPFPRHLIGQAFTSQDVEGFVANPFWTTQYVGAGPYKLDKWETGAFMEGIAFDGHILGKPKIPRIRLLFVSDPNAAIANLLSGTASLTTGDILRFQEMQTLQQQWPDGKYVVFFSTYRITQFQRKPAYASTAAFLDLRVRQALASSVDWDSINEALFDGQGLRSTGPIQPSTAYYSDLDKAVAHYPFDSRRAGQLLTDAGLSRGSDGVWVSPDPAIGRMSFETNVLASPASDNEMHIMADTWRKLGFEVKEVDWSPAQGQDNEVRNTFPGLSTTSTPSGEQALAEYRSDRIPTPQNRWTGNDRGAWPGSPDYDRLADVWETSLERSDRIKSVIDMNRTMNEQVVVINLYWNLFGQAYANGVVGPRSTDPSTTPEWNIHEWEFH